MNSQEDCFHLGAKALIQNSEGNLLILRQNPEKFRKPPVSYWDIPGGRMQRNESICTATNFVNTNLVAVHGNFFRIGFGKKSMSDILHRFESYLQQQE